MFTRETHPIVDLDAWHAMRSRDLTASRIPALHPVMLSEPIDFNPDLDPCPYTRFGRIFEPAIATAVAEVRPTWVIEKATTYRRIPDLKLGATPDFWVQPDGILECKAMSPHVWIKSRGKPPEKYLTQLLVQLFCCARQWGVLAILVLQLPEFPLHMFKVVRDEEIDQKIIQAAGIWWRQYEERGGPPPTNVPSFNHTSNVGLLQNGTNSVPVVPDS